MRSNPLRDVWSSMWRRCKRRPGHKDYPHYAGRGIGVCEAWIAFDQFAVDMGPHPGKGWSLDRYPDNDGNYEKANCRWARSTSQNQNRRYPLREKDVADIAAIVVATAVGCLTKPLRTCTVLAAPRLRTSWKATHGCNCDAGL